MSSRGHQGIRNVCFDCHFRWRNRHGTTCPLCQSGNFVDLIYHKATQPEEETEGATP